MRINRKLTKQILDTCVKIDNPVEILRYREDLKQRLKEQTQRQKKCKWCGRIIHDLRRNYCSGECYFQDRYITYRERRKNTKK